MKAGPKKRAAAWTARERDLRDLLEHVRARERRLFDAMVVILTRGDARVLTAVGTVVDFAVRTALLRPRR